MRHESTAVADDRSDAFLRRILIALTTVTALIMGLWAWIQQNQSLLPPVHSDSGKTLLRQYQGLTHDIWLILLLLSVGYLINQTWVNQQREATQNDKASLGPVGSFLQFVRRNRITTILFISYAVAMIIGTTYLYKDMVGWYADLVDGYFLDNFSMKGSFIEETMRRTDYRFFPLAHQDIHILSWFSIHIKTWMLFSAAELVGIVLLCMKFLKNLEKQQRTSAAPVLFIASMLLIHPSTGTAFFHVIYCERMLCLVFMLYINAYLEHLQTGRLSSFYTTLLWALIGIYIKDIAILLFVIPPASLWAADVLYQSNTSTQPRPPASLFSRHYRLEHWLCSLSLVFISSYIILAFIPSSYVGEGAYNDDANYYVSLDFRFYLFALIAAARAITVAQKKIELGLLDAINLSAFTYAITLSVVYKFDSAGYLALPFQLIATINIAWAWIQLIEKRKWDGMDNKKKMLGAIIASTAVITTDHLTSKKNIRLKFNRPKV